MDARLHESAGTTTLVNVLGVGGSGTTILALILGSSERGFTPGETRAWYRPHQTGHFNFGCWCRDSRCPVWDRIGGFPEDEFYRRAREQLGAEVIADSSKWLDWVRDAAEWARRDGIRVRNVLIWRNPIDAVHSWWRNGRLLGQKNAALPTGPVLAANGIRTLQSRWLEYVRMVDESGFEPAVVSYDRLIDDPQAVLTRLCERLGVPYRAGQERFWEKDHHTLFGNHAARRTAMAGAEAKLERQERSEEFEERATDLIEAISTEAAIQQTVDQLRAASL